MSLEPMNDPTADRPPTERAEALLGRLGQRFSQSRTQFSQALEQRAARANGDGTAHDTRPATERAEEMLDRAGERVGTLASTAGFQVRRWFARAREEAEDMLAEARTVRQRADSPASTSADESQHTH